MNVRDAWTSARGLLIDTNLLVLLTVGSVNRNRNRIESFKRTRQYTKGDYDLLLRVVHRFSPLFTVTQVAAEVSNLTDLVGQERVQARRFLREILAILREPEISSLRSAQHSTYETLGLTDAAIGVIAIENHCAVLTDDLDLYVALSRQEVPVLNFTHLRAQAWGL